MGGTECKADGGAPFRAKVTLDNRTSDLTLEEKDCPACAKKCKDFGCSRNHHKGLYMTAGKVVEGEEPAKQINPLDSMTFAISARSGSACGPDGELHYNVQCSGTPCGEVALYFSRDANSSTRSCSGRLSGQVNNGDYQLIATFPADSVDCNFVLKKQKVEVRLHGKLSSMLGGGDLDMTVPLEDILKLPQIDKLVQGVDAVPGQVDKLVAVLEKLREDGVKVDFVSANKPSWWPF